MGRSVAIVEVSMTNGHDGYPPVRVIEGSDMVTCNGRSVALVGSRCEGHNRRDGRYHIPIVSDGSSLLSVGGIGVAVVGSHVSEGCNDESHVIVNGDDFLSIGD